MKKTLLASAVLLAMSSAASAAGTFVVNQDLALGESQQWEATEYHSDPDIKWNVGVLLNSTITGQGDVTLLNKNGGNGLGLGVGKNSITGNSVHIDVSSQGITGYGQNTITAKEIIVEAAGTAVYDPTDGGSGYVKLNGFDTLRLSSVSSQAVMNVGDGMKIEGNEGSTALFKSETNWALCQYMGGDLDISAGEIDIQGPGAIYMVLGNLNLTADKIKINGLVSSVEGYTNNISLKAANIAVNGVVDADTVTIDGKINFQQNATINNLAGANAEIEFVNPEATLQIDKISADSVTFSATAEASEAIGGDATQLIDKNTIAYSENINTQMVMAGGNVLGEVQAVLGQDETGKLIVVSQTQAVNEKTEALVDKVTLVPQMISRIMMNDVRKRMGDLRAAEGTHGAWVRYNGGKMSDQRMDADFHMLQVGIDTVPVADAPRFGVAFSYAQTEANDAYGTTDMDSYSLAFYGTKMYDNGAFVDVIGRMATVDTDMVNAGMKGKMDNVALSLSGEFGWRFDVTDSFFFEPSVEATYTYANADSFTMSGNKYELEASDSLVGRAGFAAGFKCPGNFGEAYVRAAVVHEFMGDVTMNSWAASGSQATPVVTDGKDTWVEYAIGVNFNVNKNTYFYADVERTEGAAMDEEWRANVGVRFAF